MCVGVFVFEIGSEANNGILMTRMTQAFPNGTTFRVLFNCHIQNFPYPSYQIIMPRGHGLFCLLRNFFDAIDIVADDFSDEVWGFKIHEPPYPQMPRNPYYFVPRSF